jgi:hypothetical protein
MLGCAAGLHLPNRPWMHAFVGGGFVYVATVSALPSLLERKESILLALQVYFLA